MTTYEVDLETARQAYRLAALSAYTECLKKAMEVRGTKNESKVQ